MTYTTVGHQRAIKMFELHIGGAVIFIFSLCFNKLFENTEVKNIFTIKSHGYVYSLVQRVPPLVVTDLFEDIKDGVMLLALLEVLSGQKLVSLTVISLQHVIWPQTSNTSIL